VTFKIEDLEDEKIHILWLEGPAEDREQMLAVINALLEKPEDWENVMNVPKKALPSVGGFLKGFSTLGEFKHAIDSRNVTVSTVEPAVEMAVRNIAGKSMGEYKLRLAKSVPDALAQIRSRRAGK
jgi:hypothetical protein